MVCFTGVSGYEKRNKNKKVRKRKAYAIFSAAFRDKLKGTKNEIKTKQCEKRKAYAILFASFRFSYSFNCQS